MCALFLFWESQCGGELGQLLHHLPEVDALEGTERNEVDVDVGAVEGGRIERVYGVAHLGSNVEIIRAAFWVVKDGMWGM